MHLNHHGDNMKKTLLIVCAIFASLFWLSSSLPAQAQMAVSTPTALPDGRILYKVTSKDTCLSIVLTMGITMDKLRELNTTLDANCTLRDGQDILLGRIVPTATPLVTGPTATATPLLPTPTLFKGTAKVCFFLYNDANGDALREDTEEGIPDGAINMTDRLGKFNKSVKSAAGTDPVCIDDVPEGDYNVSVAVPEGYNPTTSMNYALKVLAGDSSTLDFGAQQNSAAPAPVAPSEGGAASPVLGILGGVLLLSGVGLGIYMRKAR
jgi:hypothetical protein